MSRFSFDTVALSDFSDAERIGISFRDTTLTSDKYGNLAFEFEDTAETFAEGWQFPFRNFDVLRGGDGAESFVFRASDSPANDRILDWQTGLDRIFLIGFSGGADALALSGGGADPLNLSIGDRSVQVAAA